MEFEAALSSYCKMCEAKHRIQMNSFASLILAVLTTGQRLLSSFPLKRPEAESDDHPLFTFEQILSLFKVLYYKYTSQCARVVLIEAYSMFFRSLGVQYIEAHYETILNALLQFYRDPKNLEDDAEFKVTHNVVNYILRGSVGKILSEAGQIRACKYLLSILKEWSTERPDFNSKIVLGCILRELECLLRELGPAAKTLEEEMISAFSMLLDYDAHIVHIRLASCFRVLCLALPNQITPFLNKVTALLQADIGKLSANSHSSMDKLLGYSYALAAIIGVIPHRKLYAAVEDAGTIFGLAMQILKSYRGSQDFSRQSNLAQISWTLIGSLMCLGKNFVSAHLSQSLLLWKDTFPRMTAKDAAENKTDHEWEFILIKKESALAAMETFLDFHGQDLATPDVLKRLITCLGNTQQLISTLPGAYGPLDSKHPSLLHHQIYDIECSLKRRLFTCFQLINPPSLFESMFGPVLRSSITTFAPDPDKIDRFLALKSSKDVAGYSSVQRDIGALCIESVYPTTLCTIFSVNVAKNSHAEVRAMSKDADSLKGIEAHFQLVLRIN